MGKPRLSSKDRDRKYTLREVMIAVGAISGATKDEVAAAIGITARALYYDIAGSGPIEELTKEIGPLIKHSRREIRQIAINMADKELEKLLGPAFSAITDALTGGADPKTAADNGWKVIHQLRGSPTSTLKVQNEGTVTHRHELHVLPRATLQALGADIERDADLMASARNLTTTPELQAVIAETENGSPS